MGYQGWGSIYPPFSKFAKEYLKDQGPTKFENVYGAYFVVG